MIMVTTNGRVDVLVHPLNAGHGISGIVDQIARKQAGIEGFINRPQRRPVGMNVRE